MLNLLQRCLVPELWQLLAIAAQSAESQGWQLFLVGGAVRDLLRQDLAFPRSLSQHPDSSPPLAQSPALPLLLLQDIDLVVDGGAHPVAAGAGVELARSLQRHYPQIRLEIHEKFQTAALIWQGDSGLQSLDLDIATARTEVYPYPAANPEVSASSIQDDLHRRDFSINAMAIRLTLPQPGELLDRFGGIADLQAKQIRVLHAQSFIDDPTRIFRAVRFAVRFGFQLEPQTKDYFRAAIASDIYQHLRDPSHPSYHAIVPALQTRLKAELKYIFQTPYWQATLQQLADLDAFQCVHPALGGDRRLWQTLRCAAHLAPVIAPPSPPWLLLLEVLLAHLAPEHRQETATGLRLPVESCDRLDNLAAAEADITAKLLINHRPSQIVNTLEAYDRPMLALIGVRGDRPLRRTLWTYVTRWAQVKAPLNGKDLKAMGYQPGEAFKTILAALKTATLDGEICDRPTAQLFLATHYPLTQQTAPG
jgi:tRNA nucleotidyltransferase (CCA-adding enzyme)